MPLENVMTESHNNSLFSELLLMLLFTRSTKKASNIFELCVQQAKKKTIFLKSRGEIPMYIF